MNEKRVPKVSIGIISLVIILTVLCLTIFSVMTLTTAMNERSLSRKTAEAVENYYQAEAYCSELANEIGGLWKNEECFVSFQEFAKKNNVDCQLEKNEIYFSYHYPIDATQALFVTISVGDTFEIRQWAVQSTKEWVADQSLQVWDGESIE